MLGEQSFVFEKAYNKTSSYMRAQRKVCSSIIKSYEQKSIALLLIHLKGAVNQLPADSNDRYMLESMKILPTLIEPVLELWRHL